ncbi:MAG TPA: AraC family transcriptional regulator [Acidobacteriaceae bacterium]
MDPISQILRVIRLDSAIYLNGEFSEPWCMASPESHALAPVLAPGAEKVIIYHLLSEGSAYVHLHDGTRIALSAGDLIAFPHGHRHMVGSGSQVVPVDAAEALPAVLERGLETIHMGGGGPRSRFICGYLVCDPQISQAFLGGLPPFLQVNIREDEQGQWLENTLKFSVAHASTSEAGGGAMLTKLSEVLFAEVLRRYLRQLPEGQTGWLAGARDPDVGKAMSILHQRYTQPWTVATLAQEIGLSRTVLSERFRHFIGVPPMTYLTRWRLRLGARALTATSQGVAQIALETGYESEAAFNRAFKREYGLPPARYRKGKATQAGG